MSRPILQSKSNAGITIHLRNHAQSPFRQRSRQMGTAHHNPSFNPAHPRSDNTRNPRFRQPSGQSGAGHHSHLRNQRNPRFKQHAQSPLQTTIGTNRRGITAHPSITPIRGSDNTRNPRSRQRPGQKGAGHHSPSAKISVIRGSDNHPSPSPQSAVHTINNPPKLQLRRPEIQQQSDLQPKRLQVVDRLRQMDHSPNH